MKSSRVALLAVAAGCLLAGAAPLAAQSWRTMTVSRQKAAEEELDVRVKYGAGDFSVRPDDSGLLYRMQLRYDEDRFDPVSDFDGRRLRLGVDGRDGDIRIGRDDGGELDLALATGVPMALELEFGAVRADLDLGGLALTDLHVETGASETRLDVSSPNPVEMREAVLSVGAAEFFAGRLGNLGARAIGVNAGVGDVTLEFTGEWRRNGRVHVKMGLGNLELRFPEGLGVKLEKKSFLTSLDSEGLVKRGGAYYSVNWEEAERRVTVNVEAAFGNVDVRWVR